MKIKIPEQFKEWYGREVVVIHGMRRRIYIYTPEEFKKLDQKISENIKKHGLTYPRFKEFLMAGTLDVFVSPLGEIDMPDSMASFMGEKGTLDVRQGQFGLEIGMKRPNECSCDNSTCGKCLSSGCKDDDCTIHTKERKEKYRS